MRTILVFGDKTFKITVPDDAKLTFGPFSPPTSKGYGADHGNGGRGTLRVYHGTGEKNCIGVFSGVTGYREASLDYSELIAKEEGASMWKSDQHGYQREEKVERKETWAEPIPLEAGRKKKR